MALTESGRHTNGQTMHDGQRKKIFGLTYKDKWPDAGFPERMHDNILYRVLPKQFGKHAKHRAQAQCPVCGKWKDAGHMGQHFSAHNAALKKEIS